MIEPLIAQMTVVTYGGGEILQKIFQAISMLFNNGNGGLIRPLMVICASIGGIYAYSKAFFSSVGESLILRYFFPLIIISTILMIPSTTVHIEDVLNTSRREGQSRTSSYSVNHVPWLLAKFAESISTIGFKLSEGIESVMHMPNDANYNSTGMIFGSEASLDISKYRLSNANLEQNLRQFARQCVLYDIALNKYSLNDIKKTSDLWGFLEQNTSNVRMIRYCPPDSKAGFDQCGYANCKAALGKMKPFFEKEKEQYAKTEIGRNLPLTLQALTGIQREAKELIGQQLTMNVLSDELTGGKFAKNRAYSQQQSTYRIMGSLASNGLVTMRIVFESLIYAIFTFIIPLSLTPGGTKYLINWAWLVIWIQMWPPLFTILNYIMQIAARYKFDGWFSSLSESQKGLSFFTSIGMQNLNDEVFALASFLSVSVPYISYILLKEGLSSFVQLASSLMAPAQNAAASSAAELSTGNYSFANSNFGQMSYNNASGFQTTMAPSVSSGYFTDNQGEISTIYGSSSPIVKQSTSELRTGVFADNVLGKNLQTQKLEAESALENVQETYSNNISHCTKHLKDYLSHLSDSSNYNENISEREGFGIQTSVNYLQGVAENWGQQYGLNARESLDLLLGASTSAGASWKIINFGANASESFSKGTSREELLNSALSVSKSEGFQENLQKIKDYAKSQAFNSSHDEGTRLSQSLCHSFDKLDSSQNSYQNALNKQIQTSNNASWFEQNSQMVKHSLNQDFVQWASNEFCSSGGFDHVKEILSNDCKSEIQPLIQRFVQHIREENEWPQSVKDIKYCMNEFDSNFESKRLSAFNSIIQHGEELLPEFEGKFTDGFTNNLQKEDLVNNFSNIKNDFEENTEISKSKTNENLEEISGKFDSDNSKYLVERAIGGMNKNADFNFRSQMVEEPFLIFKEDQ